MPGSRSPLLDISSEDAPARPFACIPHPQVPIKQWITVNNQSIDFRMSLSLLHGTPPKRADISKTERLKAALQRFADRCSVTGLAIPPQPQPDVQP